MQFVILIIIYRTPNPHSVGIHSKNTYLKNNTNSLPNNCKQIFMVKDIYDNSKWGIRFLKHASGYRTRGQNLRLNALTTVCVTFIQYNALVSLPLCVFLSVTKINYSKKELISKIKKKKSILFIECDASC